MSKNNNTHDGAEQSNSSAGAANSYFPRSIFNRFAWLPILLFLVAIAVAYLLGPAKSYENPLVLLAMNFYFSLGVSLFITYLLVQSFLAQGTLGLLALAAGVLTWGFAGLIAVIAGISGEPRAEFANVTITIHNSCVWVHAFLNLIGAILLFQPGKIDKGKGLAVGLAYSTVLGLVGLISVAALNGWMPAFYMQNQGGTPLRQIVLGSSIAMYLLTAVLMWRRGRRSSLFIYWYCLALALIVVGLLGVMLQIVQGGIVGWLGRSAQFLSGPYMLVAAILALREFNREGSTLEEALIGRRRAEQALRESEDSYRRIVETANEGIMIIDTAGIISYVNVKMAEMLGYGVDELIGKPGLALICPEDTTSSLIRMEERKKGKVNSYDVRFIRKDAEFVWMRANDAPMLDSQGRHIGNLGMYADITERKKTDLEMKRLLDENRSQRYFLETLIENAPVGIAVIDREHRYQLANSAYKNIPNTPGINLIGRTIEETLPLVDRAGGFSKLDWVFTTGETDHIKAFETHIEGREISYWNVDQLPLKANDGSVERILIIAVDITEDKRAESSLLAAKERIQSILESITDIYIFLDNDWRFVDLNRQAELAMGKKRTELIGRVYWDVFPKAVGSKVHKKLNIAMNERIPLHFEEYSKGAEKWMESHVYPSQDGLAFYLRDITERKHAQEALESHRNLLETVVNNIPAGVGLYRGPEMIIEMANSAYRAIAPGKTITGRMYKDVWSEVYTEVAPILKRVLETGEPFRATDEKFPILRSPGGPLEEAWFNWSLIRIQWPGQDSFGILNTVIETTEHVKAEEALRLNAEQLAATNKELESFSYSVSHDLRSPLRAMIGFSDFLIEDYGDKLDDEGREYLQRIQNSGRKMNELIDDMLSLSRISRQEAHFGNVDMSAMAHSIVEELKAQEPERPVGISIPPDLKAFGDEKLLTIALSNLLRNAWKYTSKSAAPAIEVGAFDKNGERIYFIRDNGAGFDMNQADKLFVPFKRLHADSEFSGTGVGLAIVERVIRKHGGRIWAEGEVGKGATIYFTLGSVRK